VLRDSVRRFGELLAGEWDRMTAVISHAEPCHFMQAAAPGGFARECGEGAVKAFA